MSFADSTINRPVETEPPRDLVQAAYNGYQTGINSVIDDETITERHKIHLAGIEEAVRIAYVAGRRSVTREAMLDFTDGYSRSGIVLDPDEVDAALTEIAEHAAKRFREFREAQATGEYEDVQYPAGALNYLLAVVAGIRDAFGYSPTPTGREIVEQMEREDDAPADDGARRLTTVGGAADG